MELSIGKWTNSQLAEWFGITEKTFRNTKDKKLQELEQYAEFYQQNKKVIITKVFFKEYVPRGSKSYEIIKDNFNDVWSDNNLDTCSRVSQQIGKQFNLPVKESTAYNYTLKVRDEFYGKAMKYGGSLGSCYYLIGKQIGDGANARYYMLTEEEEEIKKEVLKKYYGSSEEKLAILDTMMASGEINKEDFFDVYNFVMGGDASERYKAFRDEFGDRINAKIARIT